MIIRYFPLCCEGKIKRLDCHEQSSLCCLITQLRRYFHQSARLLFPCHPIAGECNHDTCQRATSNITIRRKNCGHPLPASLLLCSSLLLRQSTVQRCRRQTAGQRMTVANTGQPQRPVMVCLPFPAPVQSSNQTRPESKMFLMM